MNQKPSNRKPLAFLAHLIFAALLVLMLLAVAFLFTGCSNKGAPVKAPAAVAGEDFQVRLLFKFRDMEIYRFSDGGEYRYFSYGGDGKFLTQEQEREVTTTNSDGTTTTTTEHWSDGATYLFSDAMLPLNVPRLNVSK
jgi:hypothetical protein